MTPSQKGTDTVESVPDASADALRRYNAAQRRPRMIYAAVVSAIVIVLAVVVVVAWTRGETNNTTSRTVAAAPADLPLASPAASVTKRWTVDGRAAIGQPQWRGTIVVSDEHAVFGVDVRTGERTWTYSRSDRTVCSAAQLNGVAMVTYRLRGNCDEVTAVDANTGERKWTRTLDMDGMPVSGTPTFRVSNQGGYGTLLISTSSVVYAIDPASGFNRWTYTRYGCRIDGIALGSQGALIAQNCSNKVVCAQQKFCKPGRQLFLRDAYASRDDKSTSNPDKITWNLIGTDPRPVSADSVISAVDRSGALLQYNQNDGTVIARGVLSPAPGDSTPISSVDAGGAEIISVGTRTYALRSGNPSPIWTRTGTAAATVVAASAQQTPTLGTARITVPVSSGAQTIDGTTGSVRATTRLGDSPTGQVYPLGGGFLNDSPFALSAYS